MIRVRLNQYRVTGASLAQGFLGALYDEDPEDEEGYESEGQPEVHLMPCPKCVQEACEVCGGYGVLEHQEEEE